MTNITEETKEFKKKKIKLSKAGRGFSKSENQTSDMQLEIRNQLAKLINKIVKSKNWNQTVAADNLGINQPRISNLKNLHINKFSVDKLIEMLEMVGCVFSIKYQLNQVSPEKTFINEESPKNIKSQCVSVINDLIDMHGWDTQDLVAEKFNISQPRVSNLINGLVNKFSLEAMIDILLNQGFSATAEISEENNTYFLKFTPKKA